MLRTDWRSEGGWEGDIRDLHPSLPRFLPGRRPYCLLKLRQMGTQRGQMKGVLPCLVRWSLHAGTRDFCPAWVARVSTVQNIFSSSYTISIHLSPSPSKLARQSFRIVCLLMCVCGFYSHLSFYPNFYLAFPSHCQSVPRRWS